MAKLYFRYAVMNAGKSTQLLQIAHDYEVNNKRKILTLKPKNDTKADMNIVTRIGKDALIRECNFLISPEKGWLYDKISTYDDLDIILIDEAQFMSKENVWDLAKVVTLLDIPVICFGLKCDFSATPFEGSTYLFALAQDIEEVTTRAICRRSEKPTKATMNLRIINGEAVFEGEQVGIEGKDDIKYNPVSLKKFMELYLEKYPEA